MNEIIAAQTKENAQLYLMTAAVAHRRSGEAHRIASWNDKILAEILIAYVDARTLRVEAEARFLAQSKQP